MCIRRFGGPGQGSTRLAFVKSVRGHRTKVQASDPACQSTMPAINETQAFKFLLKDGGRGPCKNRTGQIAIGIRITRDQTAQARQYLVDGIRHAGTQGNQHAGAEMTELLATLPALDG